MNRIVYPTKFHLVWNHALKFITSYCIETDEEAAALFDSDSEDEKRGPPKPKRVPLDTFSKKSRMEALKAKRRDTQSAAATASASSSKNDRVNLPIHCTCSCYAPINFASSPEPVITVEPLDQTIEEENKRLKEENKRLHAEIAKLKALLV